MKKILIAAIALVAFGFVKMTDDIVSTLELTQWSARLHVLGNFTGDFSNDGQTSWGDQGKSDYYYESDRFKIPYVRKVLPSIIAGDKVGAAKELCEYVKMYVNSEEFMAAYNEKREKAKPTRETWKPRPEDFQQQEEQLKYAEQTLAESKKKKLPAAKIAEQEQNISAIKIKLDEWKQPNWYITRWQKAYPSDPSTLVKAKLEEYLALVATVDFAATTTGPRRKFTNPDYEKKGIRWKAIYRAGREVNTAVTVFVKDWLKGEIIAKNKIQMPKDPAVAGSTATKKNPASEKNSGGQENASDDKQSKENGSGSDKETEGDPTDNQQRSPTSKGTETDSTKPGKKVKKASALLKRLKDKVN